MKDVGEIDISKNKPETIKLNKIAYYNSTVALIITLSAIFC